MSDQSRIEPCSADHMPVIEYSSGVSLLLLSATNAIEKSCVSSARSMPKVARTAPPSTQRVNVRAWPNSDGRPVASPTPMVTTPDDRRDQAERDPDQPKVGIHLVVPLRALTRFGCAAM